MYATDADDRTIRDNLALSSDLVIASPSSCQLCFAGMVFMSYVEHVLSTFGILLVLVLPCEYVVESVTNKCTGAQMQWYMVPVYNLHNMQNR